jgi:hypothetical protein
MPVADSFAASWAAKMADKYGLPGNTDAHGFNPYADTVGPGIYGGVAKLDGAGKIVMGEQYQQHNDRPGPVYTGEGYSLMSRAIHAGPEKVKEILADFPELVGEISTGGATPLHVCGMSKMGQKSTRVLVEAGADINAIDTYGYNALHRMASNNLAEGGQVLIEAGLDPHAGTPGDEWSDETPFDIAYRQRAIDFLMMLKRLNMHP